MRISKRGQLNGKVERSHRSDQEEFYQLLSYKGDVDLNKKLDEWGGFTTLHDHTVHTRAVRLTNRSEKSYHERRVSKRRASTTLSKIGYAITIKRNTNSNDV